MILEEYSMGDGSWRLVGICMGNFNMHRYMISSTIHPHTITKIFKQLCKIKARDHLY
jgi:hypothetical protein